MEDLFIELLQVSLGTRESLSRVPSAREWERIYDEAERQAIVGLLLSGLESLPEGQLPPLELKLQWIGEVQMMEAEYKTHCERAAELTRRLRTVGFHSCILKGVALAQLYPLPERRQCGDIDIWVDGRRKDVLTWVRTQCEIGHVTWHHTDAEFFEDVPVEVHFRPSWVYQPLQYRRLSLFFEKEKEVQMAEREIGFGYPTPEFNAVFALTHAFHHLLEEGVGMRHVVDYYYVLRQVQGSGFFAEQSGRAERKVQDDTLRVIKSIGLGKFAAAMMWVLKEACGAEDELLLCEPDEKEGRFLLQEIMAAGNFGFNRVGEELKHNSLKRFWVMFKHYPNQVIWMLPFKLRNRIWKVFNR